MQLRIRPSAAAGPSGFFIFFFIKIPGACADCDGVVVGGESSGPTPYINTRAYTFPSKFQENLRVYVNGRAQCKSFIS